MNPTFEARINNNALPDYAVIYSVEVELTAKNEAAGSAELEIISVNNALGESDAKRLLSLFPLMGKIALGFGYDGKNKTVFEGVVFERTIKVNGLNQLGLTVACLDAKSLLRLNNTYRNLEVKSYNELLKAVASEYGLRLITDSPPKSDKPVVFNQNGGSDFDFVVALANELGYEFFVLGRDMYFRSAASAKGGAIVIERSVLRSLEYRTSLSGIFSEAVVSAYSQDRKESTRGSCDTPAYKTGNGITGAEILRKAGYSLVQRESVYSDNKIAADANALAQARMAGNSLNLAALVMTADGDNGYLPGSKVTLKNVIPGIDNDYYLKTARHIFRDDGRNREKSYTVELTCVSNTIETGY